MRILFIIIADMLTIIIIILIAGYSFETLLDYLNIKNWSKKVPEIVSDVYPEEKYLKAREYALANYRFSQLTSLVSFIFMLVILIMGGFGWLDEQVRFYTSSNVLIAIIFFGIIAIASDLLSLPFAIYKTFVIEEKFGFNKTTVKTFIADKLKGYLLMIIFGSLILAALIKVFEITGQNFWWIAWAFLTLLMLVITVFYTSWILPIFITLL